MQKFAHYPKIDIAKILSLVYDLDMLTYEICDCHEDNIEEIEIVSEEDCIRCNKKRCKKCKGFLRKNHP
jgi:hypothetical protein